VRNSAVGRVEEQALDRYMHDCEATGHATCRAQDRQGPAGQGPAQPVPQGRASALDAWGAGPYQRPAADPLTGDYPEMPATGRSCTVRGASVLELRDGLFSRCSDYYDMLTLLRQLGHMS
jgi:hypothetical protein